MVLFSQGEIIVLIFVLIFLNIVFSASKNSCQPKTSTCTKGTGHFVAWSAGAGRFSWTRRRVLLLLLLPQRVVVPESTTLRLLHRVVAKEQETEQIIMLLRTECYEEPMVFHLCPCFFFILVLTLMPPFFFSFLFGGVGLKLSFCRSAVHGLLVRYLYLLGRMSCGRRIWYQFYFSLLLIYFVTWKGALVILFCGVDAWIFFFCCWFLNDFMVHYEKCWHTF